MEWTDSETRHHLMQAFFMESQAHSRYAFAALQAEQGGLEVVRRSLAAAAAQAEVHARAFYRLLAPCAGQILPLEGCCAVSGGGGPRPDVPCVPGPRDISAAGSTDRPLWMDNISKKPIQNRSVMR